MCSCMYEKFFQPTRCRNGGCSVVPCSSRWPRKTTNLSSPQRRKYNAVAVKDAVIEQVRDNVDVQAALSCGHSTGSRVQDSSPTRPPLLPPHLQQAGNVEVHFQVQYACCFGQHIRLLGTPQGWHVPAAVSMTWSEGDVWNAVLPIPVGTDIEYKYLVVWEDGRVARWQEGPNNRLSAQHPGVLMHVLDTWAQRERSVREVGPRLTHDQQQKQSGGHEGPAAAPAPTPSAAHIKAALTPATSQASAASRTSAEAALSAAATAEAVAQQATSQLLGTGNSDTHGVRDGLLNSVAAVAVHVPRQPAVVHPAGHPWKGGLAPAIVVFDSGDEGDLAQENVDEDMALLAMDEDERWPASMLQKAAAAAAAASASAPQSGNPTRGAAAFHESGRQSTTPAPDSPLNLPSQLLQQQQQQAATSLAELLPLLKAELESALAELAKDPAAVQEHKGLLSEGQAVLAALQTSQNAAPNTSSRRAGAFPNGTPSSASSSGDEIAAALLSDDCEEACFCMVDAICSCADWDLSCACDGEPDTPCQLPDKEESVLDTSSQAKLQQQRSMQQQDKATGFFASSNSSNDDDNMTASLDAATAHAPAELSSSSPTGFASAAGTLYGGSHAVSITELAQVAMTAAKYDPSALAMRAAAFTDVQTALEKSAQLLQALSDPCHPLVLEADRKLATASRQLHTGYLLH